MKSTDILSINSKLLLRTVFGERAREAWVGWKGRMAGVPVGRLVVGDLPGGADCYFCPALLREGADARTNDNALLVKALVIDDVGTKIDLEEFRLFAPEPTWWLESSLGNFQVGYVISDGADPKAYRALRAAMKGSPLWGHADGVDPVHWFRLPQGENTKDGRDGWRPRLVGELGRSWEFARLVEAFGSQSAGLGAGTLGGQGSDDELVPVDLLQGLVDLVPNPAGADRGRWVSMAHAVWGACGGDPLGLGVFMSWAARWEGMGHDASADEVLWESISGSDIGRGWLKREAETWDVVGLDAWMGLEAARVFDDGNVHEGAPGAAPAAGAIEPVQREVADSILRALGAGLLFNHDNGCWYRFGSVGVWRKWPRSIKAGFRLAERWAEGQTGLSKADFRSVNKSSFYDGVEAILRQRLVATMADFDVNPLLLGTPGGTVDLRTGVLRGALAGDMISRSVRVVPSVGEDCPRFLRFLGQICKGDKALELFFKQWFGYCLTGLTVEQIFLFLYGPGGNGKSVLVDTLAWIMGDYFVKPVADLYIKKSGSRHMQEVAMLAGARMISISEASAGASWDEGRLKEHTGGGSISANFMRENSFSFVPQFKLTTIGNHQPTFPGGINPAIRRRFKMVLLDFEPRVVDNTLESVFKAEAPGILRWALNGLCDPVVGWHKTGLMVPQVVDQATDDFVHDQDIFALWIETRIEKKQGALTATDPLWKDWLEYRNGQGGQLTLHESVKSFSTEMQKRGFSLSRTNAARGFRGIVLKAKGKAAFDDDDA